LLPEGFKEKLILIPDHIEVFVFRGRRGDLVKLIWHDGDGNTAQSEWPHQTPTIRDVSFLSCSRMSSLPNHGKMNLQFVANEEKQDRPQCGENESGGMISFVLRAQKHMGKSAAEERSDDAENNRPEDRYVHMQHRFRYEPRD
jgi:hypothetical protein